MSEKVVKFFKKKYPNSQIIMTTHNTNLMTNSLMRPDCLYILSRQGYLTALCDATPRELREGHNLEKLYISGEFEDYERHDPNFSEEKISRLQKYFNDSIEVGKLYVNYPMVESYLHFPDWPNDDFENACVSAALKKGKRFC